MSSSKTIMEFEEAMQYMDPMQATDYLHKTLDFLKRNNTELCFPNISQYTEAFLVNLVTDTRNLRCKSFSDENRRLAEEIIEILELSRDVFRWAYSYENGNMNKNLLVYKKIYTNKIKNRKKKPSSMAHRLVQAQTLTPQAQNQSNTTLSSVFKLSFLNKTLRFIKNDDEVTLYYNEMPLAHAEYIQSLMETPNVDSDVGFGFKSLYAPLREAMDRQSVNFVLKMTLQATDEPGIATLKLEKIPRKNNNVEKPIKEKVILKPTEHHIINDNQTDAHKEEATRKTRTRRKQDNPQKVDKSLDTSTTTALRSTFTNDPNFQLLSQVSPEFMKDTIINLAQFATEPSRASISFNGLTEHEMGFVKRVKGWAALPEERNKFTSYFRELLIMLDSNVSHALKTCKITSTVNEKDRGITLKKTPLFTVPVSVPKQRPVSAGTRSKSLAATKTRDRSLSKDRLIQFQTATSTKTDSSKDKENTPAHNVAERARSTERRLNKRTAKLLEDMSTPVESDRGIRLMLLMGWDGGALGSRGEGIVEPIIPAVDLPPKAGLGHVPPPKVYQRRPVEFRMTLLHNMYDLLLHDETKKDILYKEPLTKKEKKFIPAAVQCFNGRRAAGLWDEEADIQRLVLQELTRRPDVDLRADISQDFKTVTLIKVKNLVPWGPTATPTLKQIKPQKQKKISKNAVRLITDEDTDVLVTCYDVETEMESVDRRTLINPDSIKVIRKRAARILYLKTITEVLQWEMEAIRFKFKGTMQKMLIAFIRAVVGSLAGARLSPSQLFGVEHPLYEELRRQARPWQLAVDFKDTSRFTLTKKPLLKEDTVYGFAGPKVSENNNDEMTDNRNKVVHAIKDNLRGNAKEINNDIYNLTKEIGRNSISDADDKVLIIDNAKSITRNIIQDNKSNENILTEKVVNSDNHKTNSIEDSDPNVRNQAIDNDNFSKPNNNVMEEMLVNIEPESVSVVPYDAEQDVIMNIKQELETDNLLVLDSAGLSDLDKDIQDLEMAICNADLAFNIKKEETDCKCDLELALNTEPGCDVKVEDTDNLSDFDIVIPDAALFFNVNENHDTSTGSKRSRTNLNCSQELDPKRSKISIDDSEIVVIISPKDPNDKINRVIVRDVQSAISDEIDKCDKFLPLLKCHGVHNGGLVYSCHDNDDVEWLENIISVANLKLGIVSVDDSRLINNRRVMSIKFNSFWILEVRKTFRLLEMYNVGLDTKSWKVISTQMVSKTMTRTFNIFIVEVDEKSLKYISEENFSLYCGIDKAEFSIIL